MPFSVALSAAASAVASVFTTSKVFAFIIKAGILFGASWLLRPKQDKPNVAERTHTETFASGPARWVIGRQKVGGVIMFWGEDWNVRGTERRNEFKGGADDLHLVVGLSEGDLEGIEAVWVGNDRFDVKFHDAAKTRPVRREEDLLDPNASDYQARLRLLPLELDPGVNAYFDVVRDQWRESESLESRVLNRDDEDDAEIIRKAHLGGAIGVIPYLAGNTTEERFQSLRHYTDDLQNRLIREGDNLNNPPKALPFADQWTTEHKLTGIACVHVRLRQWVKHNFDRRVFKSGTPNVSFLVKGMRLTYPDPNASTGEVTGWTENAAAVRYWWHTERRGIPKDAIDRDSFVQAFKDCDAKIIPERPTEWPDGQQPEWAKDDSVWGFSKYSINGVLSGDDNPAEIESDFDRQWQGQVVEDGGTIYYYPGIDRPITDTVSGADVLEYPTIAPAPSFADRVNALTMSIRQSSYHDYNNHALAEITDIEKRADVDRDFHLPTDLGEWRWTINPASAYSLALINLRRARFANTITLKLNPGNATDPVKYLKMSPGLVYQIDFPEEGLSGRRMALQSKTINPDMTIDATFLDSPVGLYEDSYRLPELIPLPPYTPSRAGARPPKPTGLVVTSTARSSSDGTTHFRIVASVDATAFRKVFRLQAGDDSWEATTEDATQTFEVNVPRQIMEITVRHLDATGLDSLPVKEIFTPDYSGLVLPTPRWKDAFFHGGTLRMAFEADEFVAGVSGVEVRYVRQDLDDTTELDRLDDGTWAITGEHLTTKPVQIIRGQEIVAEALVSRSGHYNLFARFISSVSGSEPVRGPISAAREIAIDIVQDPADVYEAAPLWDVAYAHLHKWDSKFGNTKGESLMYPAFDPEDTPITPIGTSGNNWQLTKADWDRVHYVAGKDAAAVKVLEDGGYTGISDRQTYYARKSSSGSTYLVTLYGTKGHALVGGSTGRRNITGNGTLANVRFAVDLDSIPFDVWNGYVANSSVTAEPRARWPFGRAPGFGETFDTTERNAATGLLRPDRPGGSTWFTTPLIDLGSSRRVEVRAETYAYSPGTDAVSNITFGGITIPSQRYKLNTAIDLLIMPAATRAIGSVVYSLTGLPAGLAFDPSNRNLTGTPTITGTTGTATYTATDALGGSVSLDFGWQVQTALDRPAIPTNLSPVSRTHNSLTFTWDEMQETNWYRVEYQKVNGGSLQIWGQLFDNEATITGLESSTQYRYRVIAANGAGLSQPTAFQVRATLAEIQVPSVGPSNVRLGSVNDRAAIIRWNSVSGATEFEVRWKLATDATYPPANLRKYGSTLGQIDPLLANTTYDVQVRAVNERGKGPWSSPALSVTTTTSQGTIPTVTITTHSSGPNEKRPFLRIVTNELTGETGTEIAVRILRSAENGGDADLPTIYPPRGTGPFLYFNGVGPGGTYLVRVRKVFEPPGGIGLIRYSGWNETTLTFGGVPAQPLPPRNIDNPPKPTEIQFRIYRTATATKYRVRYWKESDPDAVLQFTTNDNQVGGSFAYTLTGLMDNETYRFTSEAGNDEGWSIPSNEGTTTLPIEYRTPSAILGLKEAPLSESSAIFAWDEDDDSESYELDGSGTGVAERVGQTGITGTSFILDGLQPNTRWRIRVRGYNSRVTSGSKWGPWRSFTAFNTPPVPTGANPYPYRSITLTASLNSTEPRKIDWTATIPHAANVIGIQIRYGQHWFGSDGKVSDWTIGHENFFNVTIANDGDTYSGSFDPGYSSRLWEVDVRLLLSSGGTYDGGFTNWRGLSNQAQYRRTPTSPLFAVSNSFVNGAKPMTAPTPRVYQTTTNFSFAKNTPWVHIDWVPDTEDFESQDGDDGKSRNELRITYRGKLRTLPGFPYPTGGSADHQPWSATSYYHPSDLTTHSRYTFAEIRSFTSLQPYYREDPVPIGAVFSVQIVRHETGRATVSSPIITYTTLDPASAPEVDPGVPVMQAPTFSGEDVNFSWGPVPGADGYELLLLEDSLYGVTPPDDEGVLEQSGSLRTWTKPNARNEHFTIKVRSYRGAGSARRYSSYATYDYSPPAGVVGKITGIHSKVNGPDLEIIWNRLPGTATDNRYEISTSTDNGVTWSGNSNIAIGSWPEGQVEHTIDGAADEDTLVRIRAYKIVGQAQVNVPSTSWTTFHYVPTPTGDDAPDAGELNPINEVASIAVNGGVHLDWSSPVSNDEHPAPSRYRIQQSSTGTGPWTNYQSGISGLIDQWDVTASPTTARWFRVRPETFEADGEWIEIPFVPDTGTTVGNTDATGDSTYTTMTASWVPTENAQEYELQYKSGTGGFSGAEGNTGETTTIDNIEGGSYTIGGLSAGTHYQMRVRGKAGDSVGAWSSTIDVDTLRAVILNAPTGVTATTLGTTLRMIWESVTNATGYEIRIDAKRTSESSYGEHVNAVVRRYDADTRSTEINRFAIGTLAFENIDIRCRVRALFLDSPTETYSQAVSVRWPAPGDEVETGTALVVVPANTQVENSTSNRHHVYGVNGAATLRGLPRSTANFHPMYFRYTVQTAGVYTFTARYITTPAANNYGNQIRITPSGGTTLAGTSGSDGIARVSATLNPGVVNFSHWLGHANVNAPTAFTLQVSGPEVVGSPLKIVLGATSVNMAEGGSATVTARLNAPPTASVTVNLVSVNNTDISVSPSTMTFTANDWATTQTATISATADASVGDDVGVVSFRSATPMTETSVLVSVVDSSTGSIIVNGPSTIDEGATADIRVKLSTQPAGNITITHRITGTTQTGDNITPASRVFNPTNWNVDQTFTLAVADDDGGGNTRSLNLNFDGTGSGYDDATATHVISTIDDDAVPINAILSQYSFGLVSGGSSIRLGVKLDRSPGRFTRSVRLSITEDALSFSPSKLDFTSSNWSDEQFFTIDPTGTAAGFYYVQVLGEINRIDLLELNVYSSASNQIGLTRTPIDMNEGESTSVGIFLTKEPTSPVTVSLSESASSFSVSPTTMTFNATNYRTTQTATLTAAQDTDPTSIFTRINLTATGGGYDSITADIPVHINDDERLSFTGNQTITINPPGGGNMVAGTIEIPGSRMRYTTHIGGGNYSVNININFPRPSEWEYQYLTGQSSGISGMSGGSLFARDPYESTPTITFSSTTQSGRINVENNKASRVRFAVVFRNGSQDPNATAVIRFRRTDNAGATSAPEGSASSEAAGAVAHGTGAGTAERVTISTETYAHVEQPSLNPAVLPTFYGEFPEACWVTGEPIDDWQLPPAGNGLPPYTIEAVGLPTGVTFDADTRTLSGTPTHAAPVGGTATFTLTDANGNTESREMGWVVAVPTPAAWNEFDGGFGQINNPFQMACATKGNARGFYYIQGGTNAQDIADDATGARARVLWLTCPTTHGHRARLRGAKGDGYDYDLVVKVGDDFYFSDTDDPTEFVSVPGHADGALIGIYRYESTTTATGVNNTGDPLVLEWFPEIEHLPPEGSGAVGLSASASAERGANAAATTPGSSETDVYVLHRATTSGAWTRSAAPLGNGWVDVGVNARQIRYEVHLKEWENRALRRFTSFHRDKDS